MQSVKWHSLTPAGRTKILQRLPRERHQAQIISEDVVLAQLRTRNDLLVDVEAIAQAKLQVDEQAMHALQFAVEQISHFHQAQVPRNLIVENCEGVISERQARPLTRVALYVPGGPKPLVSRLLMLAIPAQLAQCPDVVLCTPADESGRIDPHLLVAADLCGIKHIYNLKQTEAIAAMTNGIADIAKVDKLFIGADVNNIPPEINTDVVLCATAAVTNDCLIIADDAVNVDYLVADIASLTEQHDDIKLLLALTSTGLARTIARQLKRQAQTLSAHSHMIIVDDITTAIDISNQFAPQQLLLQCLHPEQYIHAIQSAGAVFLGSWSANALGHYVTACNHMRISTNHARSYNTLTVSDFMTFISVQSVSDLGFLNVVDAARALADIEGRSGHCHALDVRMADLLPDGEMH